VLLSYEKLIVTRGAAQCKALQKATDEFHSIVATMDIEKKIEDKFILVNDTPANIISLSISDYVKALCHKYLPVYLQLGLKIVLLDSNSNVS
jgi:hypothetical protein